MPYLISSYTRAHSCFHRASSLSKSVWSFPELFCSFWTWRRRVLVRFCVLAHGTFQKLDLEHRPWRGDFQFRSVTNWRATAAAHLNLASKTRAPLTCGAPLRSCQDVDKSKSSPISSNYHHRINVHFQGSKFFEVALLRTLEFKWWLQY
jgi:hypothetical protein